MNKFKIQAIRVTVVAAGMAVLMGGAVAAADIRAQETITRKSAISLGSIVGAWIITMARCGLRPLRPTANFTISNIA